MLQAENPETARAILSVLAIAIGLRGHGKLLLNYPDDERSEIAQVLASKSVAYLLFDIIMSFNP